MNIKVMAKFYDIWSEGWVYAEGVYDGEKICSDKINADDPYMFSDKYTLSPKTGEPIFERVGLANMYDEVLLSPQYEDIGDCPNGFFCVKKNGCWGIVDGDENIVVPFKYEHTTLRLVRKNSFFAMLNGAWGVIDHNGKLIVPHEYDEVGNCIDGMFCLKKGEMWGVLNKENRIIIPFQYHGIKLLDRVHNVLDDSKPYPSKRPCFQTTLGKKSGFISLDGTVIFKPELVVLSKWIDSPLPEHQHKNSIEILNRMTDIVYKEQLLFVKKGNQFALLDEQFNLWFDNTPVKRGPYFKKVQVNNKTLLLRMLGSKCCLEII